VHPSRPLSLLLLVVPPALLAAPAAGQDEGFEPAPAVDLAPDPDVVEVRLVAQESDWEYRPGVPTRTWNYNGQIPGPTIEAEVGDLLRVHFENRLPEPTTIHWHGIEAPAAMDGAHITQLHVQPGETFVYELPLLRDGMYWYHPHVRTFDQVELGLYGVLMVRDAKLEAALGFDRYEERIVVFDDVLLDANDQVVPAFSFTNPLQKVLYLLNGREGNHLLVNGKVAGTRSLTVANGIVQRWRVLNAANATFCRLDLNTDATVPTMMVGTDSGIIPTPIPRPPVIPLDDPNPNRLPFGGVPTSGATKTRIHAARAASLAELLPGDDEETVDFVSLWEEAGHFVPQNDLQGIFLMPGERMDVLFLPLADDGDKLRVFQFDWFRGRHNAELDANGGIVLGDLPQDGRMPAKHFLDLRVVGSRPRKLPRLPARLREPQVLDPAAAVGRLQVNLGHTLPDPNGDLFLFAQADFAPVPGGVQMTPLPAGVIDSFNAQDVQMGETWIWEINNLSHGDHPFHTHGFFFQPYEVEYVDQKRPQLNLTVPIPLPFPKDTIRVPARPGDRGSSKAILRAVVRFDDTGRRGQAFASGTDPTFARDGSWTAGGWLFHCHVLEHSGMGMLSFIEVHDPEAPARLLGKHLAGTLGRPSLTLHGRPVPGRPLELDVVGALPDTEITLAVGRTKARTPFAGGILVPAVELLRHARSDEHGRTTFSLQGWEELPRGTRFYAQAGFPDPGAPEDVALTNAVEVRLP
jgi:FtsP/CotA-like multicopper oxidase with cupredoxin domain